MCGIVGSIDHPHDIDLALARLHHRGPDSRGSETRRIAERTVIFGHTRLAIVDLSEAGHQPMTDRSGRWLLTYNGEIYNHRTLRQDLDIAFRGHSDTETLVEHLAAFGIGETVARLNGMFAFAALDQQEAKLYLARDPFGIKPVYYRFPPAGGFAFASEIRALQAANEPSLQIDPDALQSFLTLRFVPSPDTLWQGIHRLPPGHLLEVDLRSMAHRLICYIEPVTERFRGSIDDAVAAYHDLLGQGIERQLMSDVPVGILLSSGIDSAIVAALAKEKGAELPCYTVGFDSGHDESEIPGAEETCRVLGLPFHPVTVRPDDVLPVFDQIVSTLEEPIVSTAPLVMWNLVKRAREDVTVALTGQGSDEPWGGYARYQNEIVRNLLPFPAALGALKAGGALWQRLPEWIGRAVRSLPIKDRAKRFQEAYALFTAEQRAHLTGREDEGRALAALNYWLEWHAPANCTPAENMMRLDTRTCLADDWLLYGDKISMAFSLETRVPILDLDVVRFVESLPLDYRVKLGRTKIVHKLMARRYLPPAIVNRKKMGFPTPFASWSRGRLKEQVAGMLLEELARDGLMHRPTIEKIWRRHLDGSGDFSRQIYALFMLASCRRRFAA
ncbi:MAG: asparagine synthase (glutamine-hydrolyzing) [Alphaproteobacteria bacterium]